MKLNQCHLLTQRPFTAVYYRAIQPQFWQTSLATAQTATIPGRFNAGSSSRPGFEILYLAENHLVAMLEVQALLGNPYANNMLPNPRRPWTIVNVDVQLHRVVDLTSPNERKLIKTSVQELTGDWRGYLLRNPRYRPKRPWFTPVPTQMLGEALFGVPGLEGFVTYSAKYATYKNLVVFPQKLHGRSLIRFTDPATGQIQQIP